MQSWGCCWPRPCLSSFPLTGASGTSRSAGAGRAPRGSGKSAPPQVERGPRQAEWRPWKRGVGVVWDPWAADRGGACWGCLLGVLEAGSLWLEPRPPRDAGQAPDERPQMAPRLLYRVPSDSEGRWGSQEPLGKWYVCVWGWRVAPRRPGSLYPSSSSLRHLPQSPGLRRAGPSGSGVLLWARTPGHTWGQEWVHLGGGLSLRRGPVLAGTLVFFPLDVCEVWSTSLWPL